MDQEIVDAIRASNDACMTLMTLMTMKDGRDSAAKLLSSDPDYTNPAVCMAIASFALSAINTLAIELDVEPVTLVQAAALSAAEYSVYLQDAIDKDKE